MRPTIDCLYEAHPCRSMIHVSSVKGVVFFAQGPNLMNRTGPRYLGDGPVSWILVLPLSPFRATVTILHLLQPAFARALVRSPNRPLPVLRRPSELQTSADASRAPPCVHLFRQTAPRFNSLHASIDASFFFGSCCCTSSGNIDKEYRDEVIGEKLPSTFGPPLLVQRVADVVHRLQMFWLRKNKRHLNALYSLLAKPSSFTAALL
ncbi:hypothetical protein LXL04_009627 [Taraxacum kok-saghyz]